VVQEKKRLRTLDENVVDTHCHQIDADAVVTLQLERQFELGPDAVGARYQHRIAIALRYFEQGAETPDAREHPFTQRAFRQRLDVLHQRIAGVDVHAGRPVVKAGGSDLIAHRWYREAAPKMWQGVHP